MGNPSKFPCPVREKITYLGVRTIRVSDILENTVCMDILDDSIVRRPCAKAHKV